MEQTSSNGGDHYSRLINELCALLAAVISPAAAAPSSSQRAARPRGMSLAAAASMLLGASMALMLCGSVTFAIGFLLMPWVAGVALLFGFAGAVSNLSSGILGKPGLLPWKDVTAPQVTCVSFVVGDVRRLAERSELVAKPESDATV